MNSQMTLKDLRGELKSEWTKFTEDDLANLKGNSEEIIDKLQEVYGISKHKAVIEFNKFKNNHEDFFADSVELIEDSYTSSKKAVVSFVKEHPVYTVLGVAAIGLTIAALWPESKPKRRFF